MTIPLQHLGDTRSGKKICLYDTSDLEYIRSQTANFDERDRFDSYCLFQYFSVRAVRQYGRNSDEAIFMERMSDFHNDYISKEFMISEKESLSLLTSIDLKKLWRELC